MGIFTYVYYSSLIRQNHVTVGSVLQTIVSGLTLAEQLELIDRIEKNPGLAALSPALRSFCRARRAHPELSLAALGAELDPPVSKSAMYHRLLRLQEIAEQAAE